MIEGLWETLRESSTSVQQRVDATHPLDLYADFQPPDRPGLLLLTSQRPPERPQAKSISIHVGHRPDGRWALRLVLEVPALLPVFAELCTDIIEATRQGVSESEGATAVLERLDRWRRLLERGAASFSADEARGLLGELIVLRAVVLPEYSPDEAVVAWTGPLRQVHDFLLPSGERIEVKAIGHTAQTARINGLDQLESGHDPLMLVAVRLEKTSPDATGAQTIASISEAIREELSQSPTALDIFDRLLRRTGWSEAAEPQPFAARVAAIEGYAVDTGFPRLITTTVPSGVMDADYTIQLPQPDRYWDVEPWNSRNSTKT